MGLRGQRGGWEPRVPLLLQPPSPLPLQLEARVLLSLLLGRCVFPPPLCSAILKL